MQLKVSGGYDRNPGRLRKRLGVEPEPELTTPRDLELSRRWDRFLVDRNDATDEALDEAWQFEEEGKSKQADRALLKAGMSQEHIRLRREYLG